MVIDNLSNSKIDVKEKIKTITNKDFTLYTSDLRNKSDIESIFANHTIDGIIHFAAFKAVGESCEKPFEYYDNNINGGNILYQTALTHNIKKIVFSSSCTVYDTTQTQAPYDESCPRATINPYGSTKFISEIILKDLATHK
ncbi:TPA: hypothetical protein DEP21_01775 [Patescibacteria group bacterium]|nr:hypothetical protein [Candidatus Gracilibacteria bacterium]